MRPNLPGVEASKMPHPQHIPGLASQSIPAQVLQAAAADQAGGDPAADAGLQGSTAAAVQGPPQPRTVLSPLHSTSAAAGQGLSGLKAADISALDTRSDPTAQTQLGLAAGLPQAAARGVGAQGAQASSDPAAMEAAGREGQDSADSASASAAAGLGLEAGDAGDAGIAGYAGALAQVLQPGP